MAFLWILVPLIAVVLFFIYFLRSSKQMPKSWKELVSETKFQVFGALAYFEGLFLRSRNKVELVKRSNKIAILTGGNRGIGLHVLEKFLKCDMTVMLGVRNPEVSQKSVEDALGVEATRGKVFYEKCDTGDMESVRNFAKKVQAKFPAIHVLVNNAGIMSTPYKETKDGFESQMAVNYIGHFLLTHLLMPQIIAGSKDNDGKNARIVNVSSCAYKAGVIDYDDFHFKNFYYPGDAYNKSKLAQVLFTIHLEKLFKDRKLAVQVHSVHPGIVNTELFQNTSADYFPFIQKICYKTPEQGSRTIVFASISPKIENKGGSYLTSCTERWPNKSADECEKLFDFTCNLLQINSFGNL